MLGSISGFHFLVSCLILLVLVAAQGEQDQEGCPSYGQQCRYLGEIPFPFTTSPKPKCGLRIRNCEEHHTADIEIALTDQNWYKIDTIFRFPDPNHPNDPNDLSLLIHYPDFDTVAPEPFKIENKYFEIANNISFFGCCRNSYNNKISNDSNMFLYRQCHDHDMYYSSTLRDAPLPIIPFACLPFQLPQYGFLPTCPSYTILFSFLLIKLNIPDECKRCEYPLCEFEFEEGQGVKCYRHYHDYAQPPTLSPAPVRSAKAKKIGTLINFLYLHIF